jgi:hypothetical protein
MAGAKLLDASLAPLGYRRINANVRELADVHRPSIYKAEFPSDDVEHFLYVGGGIKRQEFLVAKFGFRSLIIEEFSVNALLKYGHPNYRHWIEHHNRQIGCLMNFDLGRLDHAWEPTPLASEEAAQLIASIADEQLLPLIRDASTLLGLFRLLASDVEPCSWLVTHGIARSSQIVALGQLLDIPREVITGALARHHDLYCRHVPDPEIRSSVDRFVDRLIEDWERQSN